MHIGVCSLGSDTRKVHRRRRSLLDMGKSSGSCSKAQGLIVYSIPFSIFRSSSHLCLCSSTTPSSIPTFTSSSIYTTLAQHQSPTRSPTPSPPLSAPPHPHRQSIQNLRHHTVSASKNHGLTASIMSSGAIMRCASRYGSAMRKTSHVVKLVRAKTAAAMP